MATIDLHLPQPHLLQYEVKRHPAKRKVICAGRRAGKTTLAAEIAIERMLDGRRVLLSSTTQEQADAFWDKCKSWLADAFEAGVVYKNESRRILEFRQRSGRIRVKTGSDADALRGDYADFLVLDECALLDPKAWDEVGAPMLLDNNGDAMFISTPRRRNWFHALYLRGVSEEDGRWKSWHFTSYDNPYLSQEALAELTQDMTEDAIRQEIYAEFLENEGAVFRNITACLHAPLGAVLQDHGGHHIVAGVDWARERDFTATSIVCSTCRVEVAKDRFNKIDYAFQRERLKALYQRWDMGSILGETNAMGLPILEQLQRDGLPVRGFTTTASSKPPLIESLALAFEREECQWLADAVWTGELEAYERKVSLQTGRSSYSAPEGVHDDTVMARALAWQAAQGRPADWGDTSELEQSSRWGLTEAHGSRWRR